MTWTVLSGGQLGFLKSQKYQAPPIYKEDGRWDRSNDEKAAKFSEHLANTFQPLSETSVEELIPVNNIDLLTAEVANEIDKNLSTI